MKVVHVISGGETGGSRKHLLSLLKCFPKGDAALIVFQKGLLYDEACHLDINVQLLEQTSRYDLSVLKKMVNHINEKDYDIIHSHGARANLFTYLIKRKLRAPWVATVHSDPSLDFMHKGLRGKIFSMINKKTFNSIDLIFAVSDHLKNRLIEEGLEKEKIKTVYNGIQFDNRLHLSKLKKEAFGLTEDDFIIAMAARCHPIKGHEIVFKALKELNDINIKVLLIGDGPSKKDLEAKAREMGLISQVRFLGFRSDVEALIDLADISLLASYSESFPLVLLESAKMKKTVIATNVGGVNALIPDQSMGFVVPKGDPASLKEAILTAKKIKQAGKLGDMGERLYQHAKSHFSLHQLYEMIYDNYQHIL
ncbi:glycosyltransferase involved in cell wall biosynthesis [Scopulibacillus daqui]|uniref:Glycosyltransferase involved in cell wall biosynthesis n=1 Tax=Scopulibacillus daqui TaxID=1469162 RepID=A0ABS2Q0J7_9BACL|nr:glycosyltransferase [Scopulibacillus daqui]MBM7645052.1 glycosyltransferase involved in cell wall biosynthesis [Scopulibacillus daqui]